MRKSALEKQINIVIEKNNKLFSQCNKLEQQLSEKESMIQELECEIERLKCENNTFQKELSEIKVEKVINTVEDNSVSDELLPVEASVNNTEQISETALNDLPAAPDAENREVHSINSAEIENISNLKSTLLANNKLDSASSAIGRVVLKCTEACNTFVSAGDINSKDLINLALGRTEVFKSEVLSLATSDNISIDTFNAELCLKETSVIEYFELLLKQI